MSMKISSDTVGNRIRNLPTCNAVPQPTGPRCTPYNSDRWDSSVGLVTTLGLYDRCIFRFPAGTWDFFTFCAGSGPSMGPTQPSPFNQLITGWNYLLSWCFTLWRCLCVRMCRILVVDELERIWKETVVTWLRYYWHVSYVERERHALGICNTYRFSTAVMVCTNAPHCDIVRTLSILFFLSFVSFNKWKLPPRNKQLCDIRE